MVKPIGSQCMNILKKDMKKFIIEIKQSGEGCDYMIECGAKSITLFAENILQAEERFKMMLQPNFESNDVDWTTDYGGYYDESTLENAKIYEIVDEITIDLQKFYTEMAKKEAEKIKLNYEEQERETYVRLKNKFER